MSAPSLEVTWLRTSCLLLRSADYTVITDPWFGRTMRGLPVFRRPAIELGSLPHIDAVVATHLHRDHFDPRAVEAFGHAELDIVGTPGTRRFCEKQLRAGSYRSVTDLAPWKRGEVGPLRLLATPAQHTGPPPAEVNYVIEFAGLRILFGGDARWSPHWAEIADRAGPIDLAILPVGGTLIFGKRTTLDPADAVKVCAVTKPRWAVPIHEGGEWLPVPPASWHPGRCGKFEELLEHSGLPTEPAWLRPGEVGRFDADGWRRVGAA